MTPEMAMALALSDSREAAEDKTSAEPGAVEKLAMADQWGRELARRDFEKAAMGPAMNWVRRNVVGNAMKGLTSYGPGATAAGGAVAGGVMGAIRGAGRDENGRPRSMVGNIVGGAAAGGAAGFGAHYGAKALGGMNNSTGQFLRGAQGAVSKGNPQSINTVKGMVDKSRGITGPKPGVAPAAGSRATNSLEKQLAHNKQVSNGIDPAARQAELAEKLKNAPAAW